MSDSDDILSDPPAENRPGPAARRPPARLVSADLFGNSNEVLIEHSGEIYRLRITRNGKLILQK